MRMAMRIRVTTRADLYEKRKQEHIERGYRIEDERPIPVNGFCSFIAMREMPVSDDGRRAGCAGDQRRMRFAPRLVRYSMPLRIRFRFDGKCSLHPRYDPAPGLFTITL